MEHLQYFLVLDEQREFIDKNAFKAYVIHYKHALTDILHVPIPHLNNLGLPARRSILVMLVTHSTDPHDLLAFLFAEFPETSSPNHLCAKNKPLILHAIRSGNHRCVSELAKHPQFNISLMPDDIWRGDAPMPVIELILAHTLERQILNANFGFLSLVKRYAQNPRLVCEQLCIKNHAKGDMLSARIFCCITFINAKYYRLHQK